MKKTLNNTQVTVGPVKFTPTCAASGTTDPEPAKEDIGSRTLAEASTALKNYWDGFKADEKKAANYDTLTQAAKDKWDADWKVQADAREKFDTEMRTLIGYSDLAKCPKLCQAEFEKDLLVWRKKVYETCKVDKLAPACKLADDIRRDQIKARGIDYYAKD